MSASDIDQRVKKTTHATAAQGRSYPRRSVHMLKDELEAFLYHRMSLRLDSSSEARTVRVQWCASHDAATPTVEGSGCQPGVMMMMRLTMVFTVEGHVEQRGQRAFRPRDSTGLDGFG